MPFEIDESKLSTDIENHFYETILQIKDYYMQLDPNDSFIRFEYSVLYGVINALLQEEGITTVISNTKDILNMEQYIFELINNAASISTQKMITSKLKIKKEDKLGKIEFDQNEKNEIQKIIDELRKKIENSTYDTKSKERLLKNLEKLQHEINKRFTGFETILGFIVESNIVLKKADPMIQQIRKISSYFFKKKKEEEEKNGYQITFTPESFLPHDKKFNDDDAIDTQEE